MNKLEQENAELKAHVNSLRGALMDLSFECFDVFSTKAPSTETYNKTFKIAQNISPTQSLAEHDKKLIAEFRAKCVLIAEIRRHGNEFDTYYKGNVFYPHGTKLFTLPPIDNEEN